MENVQVQPISFKVKCQACNDTGVWFETEEPCHNCMEQTSKEKEIAKFFEELDNTNLETTEQMIKRIYAEHQKQLEYWFGELQYANKELARAWEIIGTLLDQKAGIYKSKEVK